MSGFVNLKICRVKNKRSTVTFELIDVLVWVHPREGLMLLITYRKLKRRYLGVALYLKATVRILRY